MNRPPLFICPKPRKSYATYAQVLRGGIQKKVTDAAIIEHLKGLDNKQGYIKALILQDMAKAKGDA